LILLTRLCLITALLVLPHQSSAQDTRPHLEHADAILDRWVARKDTRTSLLAGSRDQWRIRTMAAQLYPALVLTAWFTNTDLLDGLLRETLKDETRLTSRLSVFPDDYHLNQGRFLRGSRNPQEILLNASAYVGGLSRIAAVTGHGPWTDRLKSIVDALFLRADITTDFAEGPLPSDDIRVTGRVLKALPMLAELYNDEGYLYYARRLADAYCVGVMPKNGGLPPERWNFESDKAGAASLILEEDGVSFMEGLVALYAIEVRDETARADVYRPTLSAMFDVLFTRGLKENGHFYRRLQPDGRGGYSIDRKRESPNTVRLLLAAHLYGQLSGNASYIEKAIDGLDTYQPAEDRHLTELPALYDAAPLSQSIRRAATRIADRLAIDTPNVTNDPEQDAAHLTALLSAAWATSAGSRTIPWRSDTSPVAETQGAHITLSLNVSKPWAGRLFLDNARSHSQLAISGFPKSFRILPERDYEITSTLSGGIATWSGALISDGLRVDIHAPLRVTFRSEEPSEDDSP